MEEENKNTKMNENLLRRIKNQLNTKFYVMNDIWLRDCVEFFMRDKTSHETKDKQILEFVESQWLLSDLREISNEKGCLPRNLVQQIHIVLTGIYILQVEKMFDITCSKHKQLCEIRKISRENVEVTENEKSTEWEPKARRMMQLCLTDGLQNVTAIEYTPLKKMSSILLPGYKVMIIGPVDCRRGIILLEDGKYKEIGGEVESLLKINALENVLSRILGEPENPDPYNDNGTPKILNQNVQNVIYNPDCENNFFKGDFKEVAELEATMVSEQENQEAKNVQDHFRSTCDRNQMVTEETKKIMEEFLEDVDFEFLENGPSDPPVRPLRVLPSSRMETEGFNEQNDIMIVEEASTSARNCNSKRTPPVFKIESTFEFPDDDFDFNDCEIITKKERSWSQQQSEDLLKNERETSPLMSKSRLINHDALMEAKKRISLEVSMTKNEKSMARTSETVQQISPTKTISKFLVLPVPSKICDTLSNVLRESITEKTYRTVRGQVKNHSALSKQGKYWTLTALITDHTSSMQVCFESEILEKFLGFTVQEFSQKKKLAKVNPQMNNELRLSLRKAQYQIQNLNALLKLELAKNQMPKVVSITQLTQPQKEDLMKRST